MGLLHVWPGQLRGDLSRGDGGNIHLDVLRPGRWSPCREKAQILVSTMFQSWCSKINVLTRCFTLNAICRAAQRRTQWSKPERLSQYYRIFVGFDKYVSIFADIQIFVGFDKYLSRFLRRSMWTRTAKLDWRNSLRWEENYWKDQASLKQGNDPLHQNYWIAWLGRAKGVFSTQTYTLLLNLTTLNQGFEFW